LVEVGWNGIPAFVVDEAFGEPAAGCLTVSVAIIFFVICKLVRYNRWFVIVVLSMEVSKQYSNTTTTRHT
jgi:hypothetical protein